MSWLFSRALAEEYLEENSSGGGLSALLNSTPTEPAYCSHGNRTVYSNHSRSGMTCARLTAFHGEELLTWYLAGFRAQMLPQADRAQEFWGFDPASRSKCSESLVKFDLSADSLKTVRCSLAADSNTSFFIWPAWGMMQSGECSVLHTPGHLTNGKERGFWHPTPTKCDHLGATTNACTRRDGRTRTCQLRYWLHARSQRAGTTYPHPTFLEAVMGWPSGWTGLQLVAMDRFQQWSRSHGKP
jgi:hypothetical protein